MSSRARTATGAAARKTLFAALFVAGLQLAFAAHATDIYRWVDEQGRTHLSDVVPERYKNAATKVDSRQFELTDAQRAAAAAKAAKEAKASAASAQGSAAPMAPALAAVPLRPGASAASSPATECDRLWQAYRESQECFAPYVRRNAGPPPEAFQRCKQIESPTTRCGPPNW